MLFFLSLVTSVKDYIEVVHKLIESDVSNISTYYDLGMIFTYFILSLKEFFQNFLNHIWSLPILIPDISSSIISEVSVLDNYFKNDFNLLETVPSLEWQTTQSQGIFWTSLQKFSLGFINSLFLWLPTSVSHLIILRRFVIQGLEAGYIAGLGTIFGNLLWILSIIFGFRFFIIPWLSLDYLRYFFGFLLLIKYMWDSYKEKKMVLEDLSKWKIFSLNLLLALTEQTTIYPFISNISIGPESTIIETFPATSFIDFFCIHGAYVFGLFLGCLSLLHVIYWFWENPAFKIYMWFISSFKVSTSSYYKFINFTFLYLTMIGTISSLPYFALDYTLTNPLGFVHEDRIFAAETRNYLEKPLLETSFLYTKASDKNTRIKRGRRSRQERWKYRLDRYRTFDASLYDQGVFDLFTIEDLNYGFDRFWLRRKMRKHSVKFRLARDLLLNFKKQVIKPSLNSKKSPRIEFFRILFEQTYNPTFHEFTAIRASSNSCNFVAVVPESPPLCDPTAPIGTCDNSKFHIIQSILNKTIHPIKQSQFDYSTVRKFNRKFSTRINKNRQEHFEKILFVEPFVVLMHKNQPGSENFMTKKDQDFLTLKTIVKKKDFPQLLHPIKYYLEKEKSFQRKLNFYGVNIFRKFSVENNAPFFRVIMKRSFYYYKPTVRWEKTLQVSKQKNFRRKISRIPRKLESVQGPGVLNPTDFLATNPTYSYSVLGKRANRYRSAIYKDVLQHWYYSPLNRLLVKFDVDSFISRQPKNHFLTKNEEKLLHLRRFLMGEYYNTLRWYTYMQQYRTMQSQIGETKSFASRIYNQQFAGTFKKIRHLFAITPSLSEQTILKFDQTLFLDSSSKKTNSRKNLQLYFHEELPKIFDEPNIQTLKNKKNLNKVDEINVFRSEKLFQLQNKVQSKKNSIVCDINDLNCEFLKKHKFNKELFKKYLTRKVEINFQRQNTTERQNKLLQKRLLKFSQQQNLSKNAALHSVVNTTGSEDSNSGSKDIVTRHNFFTKIINQLKKMLKIDSKYFRKRAKTQDFWREKTFLNRKEIKIRKNPVYFKNFLKKRTQQQYKKNFLFLNTEGARFVKQNKKKFFTPNSIHLYDPNRLLKKVSFHYRPSQTNYIDLDWEKEKNRMIEEKKKKFSFKQSNILWTKREKKDELERPKMNEILSVNFYIKKGKVRVSKKGLAEEFRDGSNTLKRPKIRKTIKQSSGIVFKTVDKILPEFRQTSIPAASLQSSDELLNFVKKRSKYVKEIWKIKKGQKIRTRKSLFRNGFIYKKKKKMNKNLKRKKAEIKLENWWWNVSLQNSDANVQPITESIGTLDEYNDPIIQEKIKILANLTTQSPKTIPFYAGWDESLRKFVITNRLLSRQEIDENSFLEGINKHTTIYWRIPFAVYDQEQFFPLGRQGFAPIKWRRMQFRQTLLKTWKKLQSNILTQNIVSLVPPIHRSVVPNYTKFTTLKPAGLKLDKIRFIQKKYRRFKTIKPGQNYLSQTGPLLNEVLPTHYFYVFTNENRANLDRYISPRIPYIEKNKEAALHSVVNTTGSEDSNAGSKDKTKNSDIVLQNFDKLKELTLRRRIKSRRKYHKKRETNIIGQLQPRRRRFYSEKSGIERWRPFSKEQAPIRSKKKITTNLAILTRVRQSKRRILRGIIKPKYNFRPYAGGFVWPGDYLRLEKKKIPNFELSFNTNKISNKVFGKTKKKMKKSISDYIMYNTQPKKYLIQRHNLKVIKKKLAKSQKIF